jgi:predicted GNAT family acetyltransferase
MTTTAASVRQDEAAHRFVIEVDGQPAGFIQYRMRGDAFDLLHTEVQPQFEGRGLAGQLARFAVDQARSAGRKVIPSCAYVAAWLERHPQDQDLVAG